MQPSDEALLATYQAHRDTGRDVMGHLLDECAQPPWYTRQQAIVEFCMSEPELASCVNMNSITGSQWQSWFSEAF